MFSKVKSKQKGMKMNKAVKIERRVPSIVRTPAGLRDSLFDVMDGLRDGTCRDQTATAMAKVASQIISCARLESYYAGLSSLPETNKNQGPKKEDLFFRAPPRLSATK
jgi:superfamily II helicase